MLRMWKAMLEFDVLAKIMRFPSFHALIFKKDPLLTVHQKMNTTTQSLAPHKSEALYECSDPVH
jgi:hypothetical protein